MIRELTAFAGSVGIHDYMARGGYAGLKKALSLAPGGVIDEVKKSNLRGRGGAGFPTGSKWASAGPDRPRYIVVNADEGEPGTFKDKYIFDNFPHMVIEGLVIGAYAIGAEKGYIYIRGEYPQQYTALLVALEEARAQNLLGEGILGTDFSFDVEIRRGAGSYVVGEETALLSSLMGYRGNAWYKPPYPPQEGMDDKPTIVNNVETFACVALILAKGADWFAGIGTPESPGPKLYSVSGHVAKPGVYEFPMGVSIREILEAAGVEGGLKAVQIGGQSGPIYPANMIDSKLDFMNMRKIGGSLGSGAVLVMNHTVSMVAVLEATTHFFAEESCGRCFPCRLGTYELQKMARNIALGKGSLKFFPIMKKTMETMYAASFCPLGQSPIIPVNCLLDHFGEEITTYIKRQHYLSGGVHE